MRYRIYNKDGSSFISSSRNLSALKSWKKAYNRYNKDKVGKIVAVKSRKTVSKRYNSNPFATRF